MWVYFDGSRVVLDGHVKLTNFIARKATIKQRLEMGRQDLQRLSVVLDRSLVVASFARLVALCVQLVGLLLELGVLRIV